MASCPLAGLLAHDPTNLSSAALNDIHYTFSFHGTHNMAETDPELNESKSSIEQVKQKDEVCSSKLDLVLIYHRPQPFGT